MVATSLVAVVWSGAAAPEDNEASPLFDWSVPFKIASLFGWPSLDKAKLFVFSGGWDERIEVDVENVGISFGVVINWDEGEATFELKIASSSLQNNNVYLLITSIPFAYEVYSLHLKGISNGFCYCFIWKNF